jgi:hypothetical protein
MAKLDPSPGAPTAVAQCIVGPQRRTSAEWPCFPGTGMYVPGVTVGVSFGGSPWLVPD